MSQFLVKGKHFIRNHVWFESAGDTLIHGGYDILIIHGNQEPVKTLGNKTCEAELQRTGISDLTKSEEDLLRLVSSTIRNHINRCKRENIIVSVFRKETDVLSVLKDFAETYHGMYAEKGMPDRYLPLDELKSYAKDGSLLITTAEINGQPVQYHAYILDETHTRLLFSCSHFRSADKEFRQAIGRANDYLHWMDLLYCKQLGITEYDWGGITSFEEPNGIDKYKMKFGIEFREYYNITCIRSFPAKVYYRLRRLIGKD